MASKFLDPVSNAKTVGFIIVIFGILQLLLTVPKLLDQETYDNPTSFLVSVITIVGLITFGLGFRKLKKWALYGFVLLSASILLLNLLVLLNGNYSIALYLFDVVLYGGLSIWFFSARDRFV